MFHPDIVNPVVPNIQPSQSRDQSDQSRIGSNWCFFTVFNIPISTILVFFREIVCSYSKHGQGGCRFCETEEGDGRCKDFRFLFSTNLGLCQNSSGVCLRVQLDSSYVEIASTLGEDKVSNHQLDSLNVTSGVSCYLCGTRSLVYRKSLRMGILARSLTI